MAKRIYLVTTRVRDKTGEGAQHVQLIEAGYAGQAVRHASDAHITCEVCSTADAVDLGAQGIRVEKAGE